jgi:LPXTG-motif cell wall-anchored protein
VNVCGIAAGILGFADAGCQGGSTTSTVITPPSGPPPCPPARCPTPPSSCKCTPPPGHHHTPPPGGNTPPGGNGGAPGGQSGSGTATSVPGSLPITGADPLGMGIAAVAAAGIGGASLVIARRRRDSEV